MGKKFFLFSLFAFLAAGFGFGGVSMATDCVNASNNNENSDHVASITAGETTTYYCSLENAISAVESNTTIYLLKDINLDNQAIVINKPITLNLNNHNITTNKSYLLDVYADLDIIGEGIIESTYVNQPGEEKGTPIRANGLGTAGEHTLNIGKDVTLKGYNGIVIGEEETYHNYTLNFNGKIESLNVGITIKGTITDPATAPTINIGATADIKTTVGSALYLAGYGKTTIVDGAKLEGEESAIEIRAGELTIDGGTFEAKASSFSKAPNGNGPTMVGVALAVSQHTTNLPINVVVKGGTFNGVKAVYEEDIQDETSDGTIKMAISDGTFNGAVSSENVVKFIEKGTFSSEIAPEYIAADADKDDITVDLSDAEAKVGNIEFSTLGNAIAAANSNDIVEILKAKDGGYTLPSTINAKSIKKAEGVNDDDEIILNIDGSSTSNGQKIITLGNDITFEGVTLNFESTDDWKHLDESHKVTMKNCDIKGVLYIWGDVDFEHCTFYGANSDAYQIHINYGNVNFTECIFNTSASRFINIAWGGDGKYTVSFKDSTFSTNAKALKKAAVMVHELREEYSTEDPFDLRGGTINKIKIGSKNYGKGQWNLIFDNTVIADGSEPFFDKYIGNSQLFGVDTVYVNTVAEDTYSYAAPLDPTEGTLSNYPLGSENGGEVNVTVDGTKVYSTPRRGAVHKVTFDDANETNVADGSKVAKPDDPSKSCYHFDGWTTDGSTAYDFNSVVTENLALKSKWTYTCSSSSGGGGSSRKTETKADDAKATTGDTAKVDEQKTDDSKSDETKADETKTSEEAKAAADAQALKDGYSQEFIDAYNFARENNITTKDTIREADMDAPLTRIAMAKMLSQYAINVLGKTPDTSVVVPNFPDVDAQLDADYNNGVTLAYQLGIMGIGIEEFRPFDLVTRAEFGTALSRMLYGTADGEGNEWYSTHLEKLMNEKIITNDDPQLQELRGYVMIMLMRSAQ